jgi:hypothetical protein
VKLLKKQKPAEAPEVKGALAEQIRAAREAAEAFIDGKVDEIKNGRPEDGAGLPRNMLRQMITRHDRCSCAVAVSLLEKENANG